MKVVCKDVDGPPDCEFVAEGHTLEGLLKSLTLHGARSHPGYEDRMKAMSPIQQEAWIEQVRRAIRA